METLFYLKNLHSSVYLFFGTLISIQNCSLTVQRALSRVRAAQCFGVCTLASTEPPQTGSGDTQDVNMSLQSEYAPEAELWNTRARLGILPSIGTVRTCDKKKQKPSKNVLLSITREKRCSSHPAHQMNRYPQRRARSWRTGALQSKWRDVGKTPWEELPGEGESNNGM